MSLLLSFIGLFIAMIGLATVGFSVPLRDFDLGHALIIAGTVAIVGGWIVFGLGAVVRELRRSGRAVAERPAAPSRAAAAATVAAASAPAPAPVVAPTPAPEPAGRTLGKMPLPTPTPPVVGTRGHTEPRIDAPEATPPAPRPDIFSTIRASREPMPEAENVPLSPRARPETDEPAPNFGERRPLSPATLASRTAARLDTPRAEPTRPASERSSRNLFDTVWPTETRRVPQPPAPSREVPAPRSEPVAPPPEVADDRFVLEETHAEPAAPAPADLPAPSLEAEMAAEVARIEPKPVSILKSGVIDGMAYTLYTDGSIEAQLPKGMMRFASIDELRNYLEKHT